MIGTIAAIALIYAFTSLGVWVVIFYDENTGYDKDEEIVLSMIWLLWFAGRIIKSFYSGSSKLLRRVFPKKIKIPTAKATINE